MPIKSTAKNIRYNSLDFLRGVAVVLMIFFHLFYDLDIFGYVDIDFSKDFFWYWLPRLIVFLFMISMGMSLTLAHRKTLRARPYTLRLLKVGICAIAISVTTFLMFKNNWVYFGTLHCIFFSTLIITPFIKRPHFSLFMFYFFMMLEVLNIQIPFYEMNHAAMDYIPIWPWVGHSFLGVFFVHYGIHEISLPTNSFTKVIFFLGKKALPIYLIHQPIMYGIIWAYTSYLS